VGRRAGGLARGRGRDCYFRAHRGADPGAPSLVIAMGSMAIALQPPGAKDVMTSLFGTNDKAALNVLVIAAVIVIAAGAGSLPLAGSGSAPFSSSSLGSWPLWPRPRSRSSPRPCHRDCRRCDRSRAGQPALPARSGPGALSPVAPAGSVEALPAEPEWSPEWESPEWTRRRFLIASAATLGGVVVAGSLGRLLLDAQHPEGVVSTSKLPAALMPVAAIAADEVLHGPGLPRW